MREALFEILFPDKKAELQNMTRAYLSARKVIKEVSLETNIKSVKDKAEDYFLPNTFKLRGKQ